jgi:MinD superfamily P-loop ATPase
MTGGIANLSAQTHALVIADADVDAANLALLLSPTQIESHTFIGGKVAVIDPDRCTSCGLCKIVCRFDAVNHSSLFEVDPITCEGCAACYYQCPADAIRMEQQHAGNWVISQTKYGPLYHAHLFAGQENSGKLVTLVKSMARQHAEDSGADYLLVDGPPGIGCPVIAAMAGADLVLIVTEPTISGAHDMERIVKLADHFRIPAVVIINKADINIAGANAITEYCESHSVKVVGRIPYSASVTEYMVRGQPITSDNNPVTAEIIQAWSEVQNHVNQL